MVNNTLHTIQLCQSCNFGMPQNLRRHYYQQYTSLDASESNGSSVLTSTLTRIQLLDKTDSISGGTCLMCTPTRLFFCLGCANSTTISSILRWCSHWEIVLCQGEKLRRKCNYILFQIDWTAAPYSTSSATPMGRIHQRECVFKNACADALFP